MLMLLSLQDRVWFNLILTCSDENRTEALEAVSEGSRLMPVPRADVAARVGRNTTTVNDDPQDDKAYAGKYLDDGKNELNC